MRNFIQSLIRLLIMTVVEGLSLLLMAWIFPGITITTDGFFAVGKFENGQETLLGNQTMESSGAIVQGMGTNHLGVECLGDRLSFFVNGTSLLEVRDSSFSTGDVGLITTLLEGSTGEIWFDNFSVLAP